MMPASVGADDARRDSGRVRVPAACERAGDCAVRCRPMWSDGNAGGARRGNGSVYVPAARVYADARDVR